MATLPTSKQTSLDQWIHLFTKESSDVDWRLTLSSLRSRQRAISWPRYSTLMLLSHQEKFVWTHSRKIGTHRNGALAIYCKLSVVCLLSHSLKVHWMRKLEGYLWKSIKIISTKPSFGLKFMLLKLLRLSKKKKLLSHSQRKKSCRWPRHLASVLLHRNNLILEF